MLDFQSEMLVDKLVKIWNKKGFGSAIKYLIDYEKEDLNADQILDLIDILIKKQNIIKYDDGRLKKYISKIVMLKNNLKPLLAHNTELDGSVKDLCEKWSKDLECCTNDLVQEIKNILTNAYENTEELEYGINEFLNIYTTNGLREALIYLFENYNEDAIYKIFEKAIKTLFTNNNALYLEEHDYGFASLFAKIISSKNGIKNTLEIVTKYQKGEITKEQDELLKQSEKRISDSMDTLVDSINQGINNSKVNKDDVKKVENDENDLNIRAERIKGYYDQMHKLDLENSIYREQIIELNKKIEANELLKSELTFNFKQEGLPKK